MSIDIIGKFYTWKLKRQSKTSEQKPEKKSEKEELKKSKLTKERKIKPKNDDDESYKHRDRSTKEILDELEEMHKKKSKKD
ncbi:hypothetical protein HYX03_01295 [Candidatus Woesearchaeota archaeon]|nr:hypothetical protein [Candidatus Woesearchaeota archaeon]